MSGEKYADGEKKKLAASYLIYSMLFAFFVFKMFFYANEINDVPDQAAQRAYIIYFEEHPEVFIPKFEDVKIYGGIRIFEDGNSSILKCQKATTTCYLGHPPFYFKLMQLCDVVDIDGDYAYVNLTKLCYINIFITSLTMMMALLSGYRQLERSKVGWEVHFLFATICTCLPMYGYIGSGVNNDNLCNLATVIFWLGIISYFEKGYCAKTYWLIAAGVLLAVCAKLTAGLIIIIVCIIIIFTDIAKNRKATIIFNKYFAMTIPLYLIVFSYFLIIYFRYGTFSPSYEGFVSTEEFRSSVFYIEENARTQLSFEADVKHFFTNLLNTWMGTYSIYYTISREGILAVPFILVLILFLVYALINLCRFLRNGNLKIETASTAVAIAIVITVLIQFRMHRTAYLSRGYLGGYQARYYMPCIPVIAFGVSQFAGEVSGRYGKVIKRIVQAGILIVGMLMIYADFFYYILSYYRSYHGY